MPLSDKEKAISLISNGIASYSLFLEMGKLSPNTTIFDFILKSIPEELKGEVTANLIDEVFEYVSSAHNS